MVIPVLTLEVCGQGNTPLIKELSFLFLRAYVRGGFHVIFDWPRVVALCSTCKVPGYYTNKIGCDLWPLVLGNTDSVCGARLWCGL